MKYVQFIIYIICCAFTYLVKHLILHHYANDANLHQYFH